MLSTCWLLLQPVNKCILDVHGCGLLALLWTVLLSESWSSWRGLRPRSSPSQYTSSPPLKSVEESSYVIHIILWASGYSCSSKSLCFLLIISTILRSCEYLQKTPYTGQCWGDSFWQERPLLFGTPASLCWASVKVKRGGEDEWKSVVVKGCSR